MAGPLAGEPGPFRPMRPAEPDELPQIARLLDEAGRWVTTLGEVNPWPQPFPIELLRRTLAEGALLVMEDGEGRIVGTAAFRWEDPAFWGIQPPVAGYVHRLATDRACAGAGLGRSMLAQLADRTRAAGRSRLRLDCLSRNLRLRRYYEALGFRPVGTIVVDGWECMRFERRLTPERPGPTPD